MNISISYPSEFYVLLESSDILAQEALQAFLEIFIPLLVQVVEKLGEVLREVELDRTVLQKDQVVFSLVVALLSVVVELQHC